MKPITRTDIEQLVPQIYDALRAHIEIPDTGLIAGQALASIIYRLLSLNIVGPINDIDLFITQDAYCRLDKPLLKTVSADQLNAIKQQSERNKMQPSSRLAPYGSRISSTVDSIGRAQIEADGSANVMNCVYKGFYSVMRSFTDGILNVVIIRASARHTIQHDLNQNVVQSFDFNCCAVGIDVQTDRIYLTDDFLEFLNTAQLRVQSVHTPVHTILRLVKKLKTDLQGVYCDFQQEIDCLKSAAVLALNFNYHPQSRFGGNQYTQSPKTRSAKYRRDVATAKSPMLFGKKYKAIYDRFAEYLPGIECKEIEYTNNDQTARLFTLSISQTDLRASVYRNRLLLALRKIGMTHEDIKPVYVYLYHVANSTPRISVKSRQKAMARHNRIHEALSNYDNANYHEFAVIRYLLTNSSLNAEQSAPAEEWVRAFKYLSGHARLLTKIAELDFAKQVKAIQYFIRCEKTSRWDVIGMAEIDRDFANLEFDINNIPKPDQLSDTKPVVKPTFLLSKLKTPWFQIRELRSQLDYTMAGAQQRHCIAGYFADIEGSRIFEIKTRHGLSHLHVRNPKVNLQSQGIIAMNPRRRNLFIQHRARMNSNPHPLNEKVGKVVLSLCNLLSYAYQRPSFQLPFFKNTESKVRNLANADPFADCPF